MSEAERRGKAVSSIDSVMQKRVDGCAVGVELQFVCDVMVCDWETGACAPSVQTCNNPYFGGVSDANPYDIHFVLAQNDCMGLTQLEGT